ncbi:hypothetical protein CP532_2644 [Ophiocordyceps camponoti-leonardi (nom. inval.)]|nr:hypothetical protein CP532_2644 [Ophiocordyceps camponoti-leonardi (nom. inval.)]
MKRGWTTVTLLQSLALWLLLWQVTFAADVNANDNDNDHQGPRGGDDGHRDGDDDDAPAMVHVVYGSVRPLYIVLYGQEFAPSRMRSFGALWNGVFDWDIESTSADLVRHFLTESPLINPRRNAESGAWVYVVTSSPHLGMRTRYHTQDYQGNYFVPFGGVPWSQVQSFAYLPAGWMGTLPHEWFFPSLADRDMAMHPGNLDEHLVENEEYDRRWDGFGLAALDLNIADRMERRHYLRFGPNQRRFMDSLTTPGNLVREMDPGVEGEDPREEPVSDEDVAVLRELLHWDPNDASRSFPLGERGQAESLRSQSMRRLTLDALNLDPALHTRVASGTAHAYQCEEVFRAIDRDERRRKKRKRCTLLRKRQDEQQPQPQPQPQDQDQCDDLVRLKKNQRRPQVNGARIDVEANLQCKGGYDYKGVLKSMTTTELDELDAVLQKNHPSEFRTVALFALCAPLFAASINSQPKLGKRQSPDATLLSNEEHAMCIKVKDKACVKHGEQQQQKKKKQQQQLTSIKYIFYASHEWPSAVEQIGGFLPEGEMDQDQYFLADSNVFVDFGDAAERAAAHPPKDDSRPEQAGVVYYVHTSPNMLLSPDGRNVLVGGGIIWKQVRGWLQIKAGYRKSPPHEDASDKTAALYGVHKAAQANLTILTPNQKYDAKFDSLTATTDEIPAALFLADDGDDDKEGTSSRREEAKRFMNDKGKAVGWKGDFPLFKKGPVAKARVKPPHHEGFWRSLWEMIEQHPYVDLLITVGVGALGFVVLGPAGALGVRFDF